MTMVDNEKQLSKLKNRLSIKGIEEDALLTDFLDSAKAEIMARRYPYGDYPAGLDIRYGDLQLRIAIVMYNKQGAEGQKSHSENGVSRSYEDYDFLLAEVVPMVGGIR